MMPDTRTGKVITFYSYKGGTGRSMAVANIGYLLAKDSASTNRVLAIDWDLEAPGLYRYFQNILKPEKGQAETDLFPYEKNPGLIELFTEIAYTLKTTGGGKKQSEDDALAMLQKLKVERYCVEIVPGSLLLMKSGCTDETYPARVSSFQWEVLYNRSPYLFTAFANYLTTLFDYVLVDSRTGLTDASGICTMLLPEKLVVVFTPNRQGLTGLVNLVETATNYRRQSDDFRPLRVYPLPARVDNAEPVLKNNWRFGFEENSRHITGYQPMFEDLLKKVYMLPECNLTAYFDKVQIQHVPRYAYGEYIAVLEDREGDRLSLSASYQEFLKRLLSSTNPWEDQPTAVEEQEAETVFPKERPLFTQEIDKYRMKEEIGRGGFATVYLAVHMTLGTEVAIKVFSPELLADETMRARIVREVEVASKLEHPRIVRVRQLFYTPERLYMVMEYLPGGDLRHWRQEQLKDRPKGTPLPREHVLQIISDVAAALDYAHSLNVIHRDIHPGNILLDAGGHAKLGDFGLVLPRDGPRLTPTGSVVGTATYISPEEARGLRQLDRASDQYSLGVVAYELIVGRPPFQAGTASQLSRMHLIEEPPDPSSLNHNLPVEMDTVLLKALAKDPAGRYQSCAVFASALEEAYKAADRRRFPDLLEKARELLAAGQFKESSRVLEEAHRGLPQGTEPGAALAGLDAYQAMANRWEAANQKAKAVLALLPEYPDSEGVFAVLGLCKPSQARLAPRKFAQQVAAVLHELLPMRLSLREITLQATVGLLLGGLGVLAAFLVAVYFIVRY